MMNVRWCRFLDNTWGMTPGKHRAYREILAMASKKMISDSQKITIPSTPTAAASTLQYFHLHRGFKACNDVNYVKKRKKNIGYEYDSYLPNWGKFSSINVRRGYCLNLISSSSLSDTDQVLIYRRTQACETTPLKTQHSFITAIRY